MSERLLLWFLLFFSAGVGAQPLVGEGSQLWAEAEIMEPGDSVWRRGTLAERPIARGKKATTLRFRLAERTDTLYLVFSRELTLMRLSLGTDYVAQNGDYRWMDPRGRYASRHTLVVPPGAAAMAQLRLEDHYTNRHGANTDPLSVQLIGADFPQHYVEYLDPLRDRPYRRGNTAFLKILLVPLLGVALALAGSRRRILWFYLLHTGAVWLYYFLRKGYLLDWGWPIIPRYLYAMIEAFGGTVLLLTYLLFLRKYLGEERKSLSDLTNTLMRVMGWGGAVALSIVFIVTLSGGAGAGNLTSLYLSVLLMPPGLMLLWCLYRSGKPKARLIVTAAGILLAGGAFVFLRRLVNDLWGPVADPGILGLHIFQAAVLAEAAVLLYGLAVFDRRRVMASGKEADREPAAGGPGEHLGEPATGLSPGGINGPGLLTIHRYKIPVAGLLYLRSKGEKFFVGRGPDGKEQTYNGRLMDWYGESRPGTPQFVRISRSLIVNLAAITGYDTKKNAVILRGKDNRLPVSATYRAAFGRAYERWNKAEGVFDG